MSDTIANRYVRGKKWKDERALAGLKVLKQQELTRRDAIQRALEQIHKLVDEFDAGYSIDQTRFVERVQHDAAVPWELALDATRQMEARGYIAMDPATGGVVRTALLDG